MGSALSGPDNLEFIIVSSSFQGIALLARSITEVTLKAMSSSEKSPKNDWITLSRINSVIVLARTVMPLDPGNLGSQIPFRITSLYHPTKVNTDRSRFFRVK